MSETIAMYLFTTCLVLIPVLLFVVAVFIYQLKEVLKESNTILITRDLKDIAYQEHLLKISKEVIENRKP